jgi:hypothetical protein
MAAVMLYYQQWEIVAYPFHTSDKIGETRIVYWWKTKGKQGMEAIMYFSVVYMIAVILLTVEMGRVEGRVESLRPMEVEVPAKERIAVKDPATGEMGKITELAEKVV